MTDDALAKIGRARRVALTVTSFLVLADVLRTTDLIAVVPLRLVANAAGLVVRKPPIEIPGFTKLAAWHERTHRDPGHRWVRSLLFETCGCLQSGQEFNHRLPPRSRKGPAEARISRPETIEQNESVEQGE